jgi:hypothetical protein
MKVTVDVKGLEAVKAHVAGMGKQVAYAASRAINATAKQVEAEEQRAIAGVFDRPKAQTVKATYVKYSNKTNLEATVGIKERAQGIPAAEYLHPNIGESGKHHPRTYKRSEFMLRRMGILPEGLFTVPGKGARLDQYGNMSRGQIVQILSYFQAFGKTALNSKRMNMTEKGRTLAAKKQRQYFIIPVASRESKLFPGIWQEEPGRGITPVLMFVSRPTYKAIYDFAGLAEKVIRSRFRSEFDAALADALRTAK